MDKGIGQLHSGNNCRQIIGSVRGIKEQRRGLFFGNIIQSVHISYMFTAVYIFDGIPLIVAIKGSVWLYFGYKSRGQLIGI